MVNKVILVGNVGMDPEVRTFEDGNKIARVRLATTERIYNPSTQESKDHTEWHTVIFRRGLAGVVEMYVRKGSQLYIEGRLRTREWEDESRNKRYNVEIYADDMKMLGRRSDNMGASTSSYQQAPMGQSYGQSAGQENRSFGGASAGNSIENPVMADNEVDDLPF